MFDVDGKEFSDAEILIDGKNVGRMRPATWLKMPDGSLVDAMANGNSNLIGTRIFSGHAGALTVSPGRVTISLLATSGRRLDIEAQITPGELYVHYSSTDAKLLWNNGWYRAVPGTVVKIKTDAPEGEPNRSSR